MAERGIGKVVGGGSLQAKDGEIIHCGIDLELQLTPSSIEFVCSFLTKYNAPKGSKLQFKRNGVNEEVPFGVTEGLGVYLNGTDLPREVYKNCDVDVVLDTLYDLTSELPGFRGYWQGPRETALYMYAPSAAELRSRISKFMAEYPLCQKARVVQIA